MKRLTLVRHAKSSWDDPELEDFERPLNRRGLRDAPVMGERLAARGLCPDLLLSSPARRARDTAEALATALGLPQARLQLRQEIYEADPDALLALILGLPPELNHVFLVGHNPGLTDLGGLLVPGAPKHLPTCAVLVVDFAILSWAQVAPGRGVVAWHDFPKNV